MAEKMTITEVAALNAAIVACGDNLDPEVREKLEHMIEVRSRKRERKTDDSKRVANQALGAEFAEKWTGGTFKAKDVMETLNLPNISKANAVIRACEWESVPTTEKVKVYSL